LQRVVMSSKRVVIVSSHSLFREGLKRALADVTDLDIVDQVDSFQQAEALARTQEVDVVIIDQAENENDQLSHNEAAARLLSLPGIQVITVSLDTGDMWIYRQERVIEASPADLVAALVD